MPYYNVIESNIGAFQFIRINGVVDLPGEIQKPIIKAGVGGVAFKSMGWRAEPVSQTLVTLAADVSILQSRRVAFANLQGQAVTIWDWAGFYYNNVVLNRFHVDRYHLMGPTWWLGTYYAAPWRIMISATVTYPYGTF